MVVKIAGYICYGFRFLTEGEMRPQTPTILTFIDDKLGAAGDRFGDYRCVRCKNLHWVRFDVCIAHISTPQVTSNHRHRTHQTYYHNFQV